DLTVTGVQTCALPIYLRAERGNANFDIRHRFVFSTLSDVPFLSRFNNTSGAKGIILGGWQMASISTYQTGQPFTVNTSFDVNLEIGRASCRERVYISV